MSAPQNYKSHTRWHPPFHFFVVPVLLLNVVATSWWYVRHYPQNNRIGVWWILVSIALFVLAILARTYALKVQDRVIGLEERLRISTLVSASELAEVSSLTPDQLVGLRFASDVELPDLARRAVRENLTRKQIKESVRSWRADNDRI